MGMTFFPICCGSTLACKLIDAEQGATVVRLHQGGAAYLQQTDVTVWLESACCVQAVGVGKSTRS